jgi:hypothetical protein
MNNFLAELRRRRVVRVVLVVSGGWFLNPALSDRFTRPRWL